MVIATFNRPALQVMVRSLRLFSASFFRPDAGVAQFNIELNTPLKYTCEEGPYLASQVLVLITFRLFFFFSNLFF